MDVLKTKFSYRVSEWSNWEDIKVKWNIVDINLTYLKNEIVTVDEKLVICSHCKSFISNLDHVENGDWNINFVEQWIN